MTPAWVHPGLVLLLGAWLVPLFRGRAKRAALLLLPAAALLLCFSTGPGTHGVVRLLGLELVLGRVDATSLVFARVFSLMALVGMVYALHVQDDAQHVAALSYAGAALGVTFAGDLLTLYVSWELMAIASTLLVWQRRAPRAAAAGFRYLLVHLVGGLALLAGIVLHWSQTGSLAFDDLQGVVGSSGWTLILLAFLLNAAVPPLGAWLPDAYPEATVTGAVFMTAFTTKSAVYALIRGFPGTELLVWLGAAMAIYGVVYAVLENDARRLLAYHIISQVGYMVCGVGLAQGTVRELALNGATAHAFAHILYKALLFMGAGAVLETTGRRKLSEMGGLYRTMPVTLGLYMVGAFAISAVPLFSGFVSKSMVVSAAGEAHRAAVFLMLTLASAGTFLHTGLKLPYYMFFGRGPQARERAGREPPANMRAGMALAAAACVAIGVFPGLLYGMLPFQPVEYAPYTVAHVTGTLGMLAFTALGFFWLLRHLDPTPTISLDTDWFYRRGAALFVRWIQGPLARFEARHVGEFYERLMRGPVLGLARLLRRLDGGVVDAAFEGLGRGALGLSRSLRAAASGHAQHYGLLMAAGIAVLLVLAVLGR
jgi:multicomponent Na+:H+ antiporter subunit D